MLLSYLHCQRGSLTRDRCIKVDTVECHLRLGDDRIEGILVTHALGAARSGDQARMQRQHFLDDEIPHQASRL
jgi:hypothetical protein